MTTMTHTATQRVALSPPSVITEMPYVDLLPAEINAARHVKDGRKVAGGIVAGAAVISLALFGIAATQSHTAKGDLATNAAAVDTLNRDIAKYAYIPALTTELAQARAAQTTAMNREILWFQFLNDLAVRYPKGRVWLSSLKMTTVDKNLAAAAPTAGPAGAAGTAAQASGTATGTMGTIAISGSAFEIKDVSLWLEALAGSQAFKNPTFSTVSKETVGGKDVQKFESSADITTAARSGRYGQGVK